MKRTLLFIVQDILSDMTSDEVNSIEDSTEALQVAAVVRSTYYEILDNRMWTTEARSIPFHNVSDLTKPTHLKIPDTVDRIEFIKYDIQENRTDKLKYSDIKYLTPKEFLDITSIRDSTIDNILTVKDDGNKILIQIDKAPQYWTSFDDKSILFDSIDKGIDDTIISSKAITYCYASPNFSLKDDFVPDLPSEAFSYFIAESKSTCFNTIKQMPNQKEEQKSRRSRTFMARQKFISNGGIGKVSYGRK